MHTLGEQASVNEAKLQRALASANIPTLQMAIVHMTGDRLWLSSRYRPTRGRGMDDNDSGGYSEAIQQEIRGGLRAVRDWYRRPSRDLEITPTDLVEMFNVAMGEQVGPEYGELFAHELGLDIAPESEPKPHSSVEFNAVIVGAGPSGLAAALELDRIGVPYVILEMNSSLGGTWFENRYPGCGCDTPSHLYSFRDSSNAAGWSRYYAGRDELREYLDRFSREMGIEGRIRTGCEVTKAIWDDTSATWKVFVDKSGDARRSSGSEHCRERDRHAESTLRSGHSGSCGISGAYFSHGAVAGGT